MATFDRADTASQVMDIVGQKLGRTTPMLEQQTFQEIGADSLDIVEIVMRLEEVFGIEINDEDAEKLQSLKDVIDYVHRLRTK